MTDLEWSESKAEQLKVGSMDWRLKVLFTDVSSGISMLEEILAK